MQKTTKDRKTKAGYTVLIGVTPGYRKNGAPKVNATAYTTHNADGTPNREKTKYKLVVYGTDPNSRLREGPIKVSCSCPDFTYTYEVTLHNQGAADILHSNGEPSDTRNPSQRPGVCCHLYRLIAEIAKAKV
jgi:hypothetical protein